MTPAPPQLVRTQVNIDWLKAPWLDPISSGFLPQLFQLGRRLYGRQTHAGIDGRLKPERRQDPPMPRSAVG